MKIYSTVTLNYDSHWLYYKLCKNKLYNTNLTLAWKDWKIVEGLWLSGGTEDMLKPWPQAPGVSLSSSTR